MRRERSMLYRSYNYNKGSDRIAQKQGQVSVTNTRAQQIQITDQLNYYKLSYIGFGIKRTTLHSAYNAID